nr:EOG090X0LYT [Lepidurus arcticus]
MNSANKVGEIFSAAGIAFTSLAKLTMQLHPSAETTTGGKWSEEEVDMLRQAVKKFADDMEKITEHVKDRTVSQLRTGIQKKTYEAAGLPAPVSKAPTPSTSKGVSSIAGPSSASSSMAQRLSAATPSTSSAMLGLGASKAEVTLNALNASESEVDVEGISFDVASEVVTS